MDVDFPLLSLRRPWTPRQRRGRPERLVVGAGQFVASPAVGISAALKVVSGHRLRFNRSASSRSADESAVSGPQPVMSARAGMFEGYGSGSRAMFSPLLGECFHHPAAA
jgi:hypothetical protein